MNLTVGATWARAKRRSNSTLNDVDPYTALVVLTSSLSHIGHAVARQHPDELVGQWAVMVIDRARLEAGAAFTQDTESQVEEAVDVVVAAIHELCAVLPAGEALSHAKLAQFTVKQFFDPEKGVEEPF